MRANKTNGQLEFCWTNKEGCDMTTEAVVAKVMWILAQTTDFDEIRKMFYTPVACDILYS